MKTRRLSLPIEFRGRKVRFKVLHVRGDKLVPCSGGRRSCIYSAPTQLINGSWEPGEWMPRESVPWVCHRGYHVTGTPTDWIPPKGKYRIFWVECRGRGDIDGCGDKAAYSSVRLLRPVTLDDMLHSDVGPVGVQMVLPHVHRRVLLLAMVARGLQLLKRNASGYGHKVSTPAQVAVVRSYLMRCAAHGRVLKSDILSHLSRMLYMSASSGAIGELPRVLSFMEQPNNSEVQLSLIDIHFFWDDVKKRVAPELLCLNPGRCHINMKTYKVVPTLPRKKG